MGASVVSHPASSLTNSEECTRVCSDPIQAEEESEASVNQGDEPVIHENSGISTVSLQVSMVSGDAELRKEQQPAEQMMEQGIYGCPDAKDSESMHDPAANQVELEQEESLKLMLTADGDVEESNRHSAKRARKNF
ncbi:uncharacterized protein LOC119320852 [Triticum dicoccoides]|uniref:uncharacterized protein LOC119320852 n=1 Tax=Triticum dicoccoides TaxID=85692 RepID=UPI001891839A|nr:uncharacterized protein LOC119320852 [Triticum dicoccoides]